MGVITYNGVASSTVGIVVEEPPVYVAPEKDYEAIHVPGRNGDILLDKKTYKNVSRKYKIAFGSDTVRFGRMAPAVSEWLHSTDGYARLSDDYEIDYYRMASYVDEVEIENLLDHAGRAEIEFDCKPQRFLVSGDSPLAFMTDSFTITNPTKFPSLPLLEIFASNVASVYINGEYVLGVQNASVEHIVVDCELQDAYLGQINMNQYIRVPKNFPTLAPGVNNVSVTGIDKIVITPRWWTL